jgi:hypothetical protein
MIDGRLPALTGERFLKKIEKALALTTAVGKKVPFDEELSSATIGPIHGNRLLTT